MLKCVQENSPNSRVRKSPNPVLPQTSNTFDGDLITRIISNDLDREVVLYDTTGGEGMPQSEEGRNLKQQAEIHDQRTGEQDAQSQTRAESPKKAAKARLLCGGVRGKKLSPNCCLIL